MIENEMLFLGLLMDGPQHGYELKRRIAEELYPFVGLKIKSIYYPLQKMESLGYVAKDIGREGRFPEKFVYQITSKGRKRFEQLIHQSLITIERPYFNIDLSLYFLEHVPKETARRKLKGRMIFLKRIERDMEELLSKSFTPGSRYRRVILEHDLDLVRAELKSLERLIIGLN